MLHTAALSLTSCVVQSYHDSCEGSDCVSQVLPRGARNGAHLRCVDESGSRVENLFQAENKFSDFTLYFLAFDHSEGKQNMKEKRANRTNREGTFDTKHHGRYYCNVFLFVAFRCPRANPQPRNGVGS